MLSEDEVTARAAYDLMAGRYAEAFPDLAAEAPADRELLDELAAAVRPTGPLLDAGCGTGRVAAYLRRRGVAVVGLDLSAGMLAEARRRDPGQPVVRSRLRQLPVRDGAAGGVLAWYSVIHTAPGDLPAVVAELARVLAPGAPALVGFQCGEGERVERTEAFGQPVRRTNYRHRVELVAGLLEGHGVALTRSVVREPWAEHETAPQAFLLGVRGHLT